MHDALSHEIQVHEDLQHRRTVSTFSFTAMCVTTSTPLPRCWCYPVCLELLGIEQSSRSASSNRNKVLSLLLIRPHYNNCSTSPSKSFLLQKAKQFCSVEWAFGVSQQAKLWLLQCVLFSTRSKFGKNLEQASRIERSLQHANEGQKEKVVPGIELGLPESESDVLTITLYNLWLNQF